MVMVSGLAGLADLVDPAAAAPVRGMAGPESGVGGAREPEARALFLGPEAGFDGQRFCIHHPPHGRTLAGRVVYVHPFAEEMNKSRHMAALQSRALAQAGFNVLQIDLLGCGDSSGDFADARWQAWVDDVVQACAWLERQGAAPLWLWGARAGCLLAVEAARRLAAPCNFLFWQPTPSGRLALQQFMRLKLAADMLAGQSKGAVDALRAQLAANSAIDVAGYRLAPALASGLEAASLQPPVADPPVAAPAEVASAEVASAKVASAEVAPAEVAHALAAPRSTTRTGAATGRVEWLEVQARAEPTIAPASMPALQAWREAGFTVRSQAVSGPAFWQAAEAETAPQLIAATLAALVDRGPA